MQVPSGELPTFALARPVSIALFDPSGVYEQEIGDRKIVYLDHNVWIELREAKTSEARAARAACEQARASGTAVFPLSYSAVSEIARITDERARTSHADLVDAIAQGITLRPPAEVYALEARAIYDYLFHGNAAPSHRKVAYSRLPDHLGTGHFTFRENTPLGVIAPTLDASRVDPRLRSVRWLTDHADLEQIRRNHDASGYVEKMNAVHAEEWKRFGASGKLDVEGYLTWKRAHLFLDHVVPVIERAIVEDHSVDGKKQRLADFQAEQGDGGPKRLRDAFRSAAPSLELAAQMFAARASHRDRRAKEQDFWDLEHAALAPVYADVFVTFDHGLAALLPSPKRPSPGAKAPLLRSLAELAAFLA